MAEFRIETDSLGEVKVPAEALYGAQTERARENFPVSGLRIPRRMIRALGLVKKDKKRVRQAKHGEGGSGHVDAETF